MVTGDTEDMGYRTFIQNMLQGIMYSGYRRYRIQGLKEIYKKGLKGNRLEDRGYRRYRGQWVKEI